VKSEKIQFNVYLPRPLVALAKHKAVDMECSLSVLVERALIFFLEQSPDEALKEQAL